MKKSRKRSGFVIYSYFKFSAFTLVERDAKFEVSYKKGVTFVKKRRSKGVPFPSEMVCKRIKGLDGPPGRASPHKTLFIIYGILITFTC